MTKATTNLCQLALLAKLLVGMAACSVTESDDSAQAPVAPGDWSTESEQNGVQPPMNLSGQIEFSKKDLAQRLDVPQESVQLSGARQVTWRSGALGCPEPGMTYTDALVPGAVIYLKAAKQIHAYHAKFAAEPFYCPRDRVEPPAPDGDMDPT